MSNWTVDAQGEYVDWLQPPYREDAILRLVLCGEDPNAIHPKERRKRIIEYYRLVKREGRRQN